MTQLTAVTASDLDAVRTILQAAGLPTDGVADQFGPGWAVARAGTGALIGAAGVERYGNWGLLRSVAVLPAWRGGGVGGALARDRIAWARAQGLDGLYLLTDTAAEYWLRFGFHTILRDEAPVAVRASVEWAHACPQSAVAMACMFA